MQLANAHTAAVPQEHPTRRTAMLGAAVLPLTGASVGQDPNDGPLLMACARLKALCSKPLPDADDDADEAIMARHELFQDEICSRTAMTAAGVRAQVLAWLTLYGHSSDGKDALVEMFGDPADL